jgi:hypothetical protein
VGRPIGVVCYRTEVHDLDMIESGKHRAELLPPMPAGKRFGNWLRTWPRRPRQPVTWRHFIPRTGLLFEPCLLAAGLMYGGVCVLFGSHQTFRLGGALALLGGIVLTTVIILYICRPTSAKQKVPGSGR